MKFADDERKYGEHQTKPMTKLQFLRRLPTKRIASDGRVSNIRSNVATKLGQSECTGYRASTNTTTTLSSVGNLVSEIDISSTQSSCTTSKTAALQSQDLEKSREEKRARIAAALDRRHPQLHSRSATPTPPLSSMKVSFKL